MELPAPSYLYYQCPLCERRYRTAAAAAQGWTCCGVRLQACRDAAPAAGPGAPPVRLELYEILPGRDSEVAGRGAENMFAALGTREPYSLEIWSERDGHHLLVRAPTTIMSRVLGPLRAIYPQAGTRPLPCAQPGDPAFRLPDESLAAVELRLEAPGYLPLRTFQEEDYLTADPLASILGNPLALEPGERLLSQLILHAAPADWGRGWVRLARDANPFDTLPAMRTLPGNVRAGLTLLLVTSGGAALLLSGLQLLAGHILESALTLGAGVILGVPLTWGVWRLGRVAVPDPLLVREKLSGGPAFHVWIRLLALGPDRERLGDLLNQAVAAYRQMQHGLGNNLQPHDLPADLVPYDIQADPLAWTWRGRPTRPPGQALPLLTAREMATLWHLPHRDVELPLIGRPAYKRLLPPLGRVRAGVLVGHEEHLGRQVAVRLPLPDLQKHTLLVGKTQRGKSTLMGHLVDAAIREGDTAILVIDPHSDLVRGLLARIPPAHRERVVYVDLNNEDWPVGLNLLDRRSDGRGRRQIVDSLITDFARVWRDYWGPRMSDVFRHALAALVEANERVERQLTLLDVNGMVADKKLREYVLQHVRDPEVRWWWGQNKPIMEQDGRRWEEIVRPVMDKINLFAVYDVTRNVFGQPTTTLNLPTLIRGGKIILVDTAAGLIGMETASLVGIVLLDVVANFLRSQGEAADRAARSRAMVVVDEFQTIPANYEGFIAEIAKFGGHIVLGTQSLRRLDVLDPALRQTILSNISNLFVFQASAEDADLLVDELDAEMRVTDVVNLADFACYAKVGQGGERLPAFSMAISKPAVGDEAQAQLIAAASAERYGRPRLEVEREIAATMQARYSEWSAADAPLAAAAEATATRQAPRPAGVSVTGKLGY